MRTRGFTLIELMIVVAVIGILAVMAIPSFLRFHARSKRAEVKVNMRAAYTAERGYFAEKDSYSESLLALGIAPERGNRFAYLFGASPTWVSRTSASNDVIVPASNAIEVDTFRFGSSDARPLPLVMPNVVTGSTGSFLFASTGNIDNDPVLDSWSISSVTRDQGTNSSFTLCHSARVAAGELCGDRDDL